MFFDGGCRGNPGPGGCGAVIACAASGDVLWEGWCYLADATTTNNVAEYGALILGCAALGELPEVRHCAIYGDSKLIVNQVTGSWRARDERLAALHARAALVMCLEALERASQMDLCESPDRCAGATALAARASLGDPIETSFRQAERVCAGKHIGSVAYIGARTLLAQNLESYEISHVPRAQNEEADRLANEA